ncbi:MAG: FAD-dependent thymidylate synthase [Amphritea sp.]|nr:FAD-dependent thymidylate synthase [Amphritea sp.]
MPDIFIEDELTPEASAMLQALYSRSCDSARAHIDTVHKKGSAKFMESYYVGYGHASIGDCGTTTIFIEGVSTIACKAIQDNPLYSGQESSTRYIDFTKQGYVDPIQSDLSKEIFENWLSFYEESQQSVLDHLKSTFTKPEGTSDRIWEKTLEARKFDILRGFLPSGVKTQLAWTTNLRQAADKLKLLRHHPTKEVSAIANKTTDILKQKYPSSFGHKTYSDQESYLAKTASSNNYLQWPNDTRDCVFEYSTTIDNTQLENNDLDTISSRPIKTNLPRHIAQYGQYKCRFLLDFGSFRDLQRHRNGICRVPLITDQFGFNPWYVSQLPSELQAKAKKLIKSQFSLIRELQKESHVSSAELQYYYPLGTDLLCETVYDLPQMVYVTELRADKTVHPTLRFIMHHFHKALKSEHPKLKLYTDLDPDNLDCRRGHQDILKKN